MGISATQGRFLSERLRCSSDKEAAEKISIAPATVYQWKMDYPEFKRLYDGLGEDGVKIATEILRQNLGRAAEAVRDALEAKDQRGKPDHIVRMGAAKLNMQACGMLKDRIDIHVVREEARKLADMLGLDPAAIVAEAERIVARQG